MEMTAVELAKNLNAFNNVLFDDVPHTYTFKKEKMISVTKIIQDFENEFDSEVEAPLVIERHNEKYRDWFKGYSEERLSRLSEKQKYYTRYANRTVEDVLAEWHLTNIKGTSMGSIGHAFMEQLVNNRILKDIEVDIDLDLIKDKVRFVKIQMFNFWKKFGGSRYLTIAPEFVLFDEELKLGGMIDFLGYDVVDKCFVILDWKTNKEIKTESWNHEKKLKGMFSHLDDCEFNIYSMQLNLYKYILEHNTTFKIGALRVVHFDIVNEDSTKHNYKTYELPIFNDVIMKELIEYIKNRK